MLTNCGKTAGGRKVLGGAFQLADTMGVPLWLSLDLASVRKAVISIPHYFASAMEHGWDDKQTFGKIREAWADRGETADFASMELACVSMFMDVAATIPGQPATAVGKRMRELLEVE